MDNVGYYVYIADYTGHRVRKVNNGIITAIAGTGSASATPTQVNGDGGAATVCTLNSPSAVVMDSSGNLYLSDKSNNKVRKVTTDFIIITFAGTGSVENLMPTVATSTGLNKPHGIFLTTSGVLYVTENSGNRIRTISTSTNIVTTIIGELRCGLYYVGFYNIDVVIIYRRRHICSF